MRRSLKRHPDSPRAAATAIDVEVMRPRPGSLVLNYTVTGTIGDLRLPAAAAPARADELWRHTCFEAFIRASPGEAYYEFNFSPSTRWAAYRFDGYRSGMRIAAEIAAPRIELQSSAGRCSLRAELDVSPLRLVGTWRLGLAAVLEELSGPKSYWALAHPRGKPDFHHADCFACEFS